MSADAEIGIPELHIQKNHLQERVAIVSLPVIDGDGKLLDPLVAIFEGENFNTFYENYIDDKYLVDVVLQKHGIQADTSVIIEDFKN